MSGEKQNEVPDWTVWLRSRLERLASSEGEEDSLESPDRALALPLLSAPPEDQALPDVEAPDPAVAVDPALSAPPESLQQDAALPTGPDPAVVAGLESLRSAVAALPTGPDPAVVAGLESLRSAVAALPTGPDPAVVAGLESLRSAVAALPTGPDPAVVAGLESLRSATAALSIRVETLADANSSFRSVLNERLDEYAETVLRVVKSTTADLEEYRRMHAASISDLRRTAAETADSLARLAGKMEELATIQADDERWVEVIGQFCDEVTAERTWGRRREEARAEEVSSSTKRLAAVEETLDLLTTHVTELAARAQVVEKQPPPALSLEGAELRTLAAAVAEALVDHLPPTAPIPLGPPVPAARPPAKRTTKSPAKSAARKRTTGTAASEPTSSPGSPRSRRTTPIQVRGPVDPND